MSKSVPPRGQKQDQCAEIPQRARLPNLPNAPVYPERLNRLSGQSHRLSGASPLSFQCVSSVSAAPQLRIVAAGRGGSSVNSKHPQHQNQQNHTFLQNKCENKTKTTPYTQTKSANLPQNQSKIPPSLHQTRRSNPSHTKHQDLPTDLPTELNKTHRNHTHKNQANRLGEDKPTEEHDEIRSSLPNRPDKNTKGVRPDGRTPLLKADRSAFESLMLWLQSP